MSRIGKLSIIIPENVEIKYSLFQIWIKGEFGVLTRNIPKELEIIHFKNTLNIKLKIKTKYTLSLQGLYRTLINNMIIGVSKQFKLNLILKGIGYRAFIKNQFISLNLGYSHPIQIKIPENIIIEINQNTIIILKSCDKELLGSFAAKIRNWRSPEPYKGKGVLYENEKILYKTAKTSR